MAQAAAEQECIARIAAEIQFLTESRLGIADDDVAAFIKLTEMDIAINDILKSKAADRTAAIANAQIIVGKLAQLQMKDEELRGQIQARRAFLSQISTLVNKPGVKLTDLAAAVEFIEKRRIDNQWDNNNTEFGNIESHFDALGSEMRELVRSYYQKSKAAAHTSFQAIQDNGFPVLCYIMTFLCLLPLECRRAVVAYLDGTLLGPLASTSVSDQACIYWKAKTAGYMYSGLANLDPSQIQAAMIRLYGATTFALDTCQDVCFAFLLNFNNIATRAASAAAGRGGEFLLGLASMFSDQVGLVYKLGLVPLDIVDTGSDTASVSSVASAASVAASIASGASSYITAQDTPLLSVQVVVPSDMSQNDLNRMVVAHYNGPENRALENYIARMQRQAAMQGIGQGAALKIQRPEMLAAAAVDNDAAAAAVDDDDRIVFTPLGNNAYGNTFNASQTFTPRSQVFDPQEAMMRTGYSSLFQPTEQLTAAALASRKQKRPDAATAATAAATAATDDALNNGIDVDVDPKRLATSSQGNLGGRRRKRKSMRHKKRRSTLKRRGLKRRKTRKGKKKRYTKKRR